MDMDVKRLKEILKRKQEECAKLQQKVKQEKQRDLKKKKEMEGILAMIKATDNKKKDLQRSLENSRAGSKAATPKGTPKKGKKSSLTTTKKTGRKDTRKLVRSETREHKDNKTESREYKETLKTMLKLKQGSGNEEFSELVQKAMEATNNILYLKKSREKRSYEKLTETQGKTSKVGRKSDNQTSKGAENVIQLLEKVSVNAETIESGIPEHNSNAVNSKTTRKGEAVELNEKQTKELLAKLKGAKTTKEAIGEKLINILFNSNNENDTIENLEELCKQRNEEHRQGNKTKLEISEVENMKIKKLTSRRCAKPDESDIESGQICTRMTGSAACRKQRFRQITFSHLNSGGIGVNRKHGNGRRRKNRQNWYSKNIMLPQNLPKR